MACEPHMAPTYVILGYLEGFVQKVTLDGVICTGLELFCALGVEHIVLLEKEYFS